ncbi:hypothetical protein M2113_001024 [Aurantimicrobium minutum]|uniref:hypothetical protein n=1 Tax=Aurantimicrobium minutum TaxID=708131 RepID=UPI0024757E91|nr:hypothetical protein [Aurantimicrobium minutum]MDH6410050.1 hypothetical protein [Aurantimicrobium minutum]
MDSNKKAPSKEQTAEFLAICRRIPRERILQIGDLARGTFPAPAPSEFSKDEKFLFDYSQQELDFVLSHGGVLDGTSFD